MDGPHELNFWNCIPIILHSKYNFTTKMHTAWHLYQTITFFPIFFFTIHRFIYQLKNEDYYDKKKELPSYKIDLMVKIYTFVYFLFYIPGVLMNVNEFFVPCKFFSIAHHLITCYGAWNFMYVPYFPWFNLLPLGFHSLLLIFYDYQFHKYIYLIFIIMCYYGYTQKPYVGRIVYERIKTYIQLLSCALVGLWLFSCDNDFSIE